MPHRKGAANDRIPTAQGHLYLRVPAAWAPGWRSGAGRRRTERITSRTGRGAETHRLRSDDRRHPPIERFCQLPVTAFDPRVAAEQVDTRPENLSGDALDLVVRLLFELGDEPPSRTRFDDRICEAICRLTSLERAVLLLYDPVPPARRARRQPRASPRRSSPTSTAGSRRRRSPSGRCARTRSSWSTSSPATSPTATSALPTVAGISCTPVVAGGPLARGDLRRPRRGAARARRRGAADDARPRPHRGARDHGPRGGQPSTSATRCCWSGSSSPARCTRASCSGSSASRWCSAPGAS